MRFLVDESTGRSVAEYLRTLGHDVLSVSESTPQAKDAEIVEMAGVESRILITNDRDFGELVFRKGFGRSGVLLLRLHEDNSAARVRIVALVLQRHAERLAGRFTVAGEKGIRIRSTPGRD